MKVRKQKKRIMVRMAHQSWDEYWKRDKMYYVHFVKRCKEYSPWCADCIAVQFRNEFGRYPHSLSEFDGFERAVQEDAPVCE